MLPNNICPLNKINQPICLHHGDNEETFFDVIRRKSDAISLIIGRNRRGRAAHGRRVVSRRD